MRRISVSLVAFALVALGGCSVREASDVESSGRDDKNSGAAPATDGAMSASPGGRASGTPAGESAGGASGSASSPGSPQQSGLLTAGVWDDNLNFDFFAKYVSDTRLTLAGVPAFSTTEREAAKQKWSQRVGASELDVTFLLDTTGSMGDELSYLQTEIDGIATTIKSKFPQTTPRFGLVLYKDKGDEYLTRSFDFTGIDEFRSTLAGQTVGGGGDYPEAVAAGLDQAVKLSWRPGAVSRMTFWVADAPHHDGEQASVKASIDAAVAKDVHIYPVAASGIDSLAEFTMRSAAQLTGGRYVFLTDDSGIGDTHAEPHIPCYRVTRFDGALVRMVESEMSGTHVEPKPEEVLRTVGDPQGGRCATKDSGDVSIY